jgi:hypothetical protein
LTRLDRATQQRRVRAANEFIARVDTRALGGPHSRAMTIFVSHDALGRVIDEMKHENNHGQKEREGQHCEPPFKRSPANPAFDGTIIAKSP